LEEGDATEAQKKFERAVEIYKKEGRGDSEAGALMRVGRAKLAQGDISAARLMSEESMRMLSDDTESDEAAKIEPTLLIAEVNLAESKPQEALEQTNSAEEIIKEALSAEHRLMIEAGMLKARALADLGETGELESCLTALEQAAQAPQHKRYAPEIASLRNTL